MIRRLWSAFLVLLFFTVAWPCGPFVPTFNLVVMRIPDGDYADWVAGRMGLLQPGLHTSDLVVAWRWLAGLGLNANEQQALLAPASASPGECGLEAWTKARAEAGAAPLEVRTYRTDDYRGITLVGDHSLTLAARTLRERIQLFGRNSAAVKQWLQAQDLVFNWQSPEALPAPAGSGLPLLIRQDRAYQRAAAQFYREDYLEALEAFQAVAEDGANPWGGWARFAIARIYAKVGSIAGSDLEARQALANLAQIQADPALVELHGDAAALENRIRFLEDPPAFYARLIQHLGSKNRGPGLAQDIEDLRWLRVLEPWTKELKDTQPAGVHAWIHLLQEGSLAEAMGAYDAHPDVPNLVAVMMSLPKDHPRAETFLRLAQHASLKPGPAYATLVSHRLRILVAQKRLQAAEALADEALAQPGVSRWPSAFNLWSGIKLAQAHDMDAFAAQIGRRLASIGDGDWSGWSEHPDDSPENPRLLRALDPSAVVLLNRRTPLRLWEELLASPRFPGTGTLKAELLEALWTRAAVLDREDVMTRHQAALAKARPALAKDLAAWQAEKNPARRRALAYVMIWEQRLWPQVLTFREEAFQYGTIFARWEGPPEAHAAPAEGAEISAEPPPRGLGGYDLTLSPAFLDAAATREGEAEAAKLPAPLTWYCEQALAFAQALPKDPAVPGALSRAVRSSRNGNRDSRSAALVVQAFRLLHKQYPNTQAAQEAKVYH